MICKTIIVLLSAQFLKDHLGQIAEMSVRAVLGGDVLSSSLAGNSLVPALPGGHIGGTMGDHRRL